MHFIVKGSYFCKDAIPRSGMVEVRKFFRTEDKARKFCEDIVSRTKGSATVAEHKLVDSISIRLI